jgi:integrase
MLLPPAMEALLAQKAYTYLEGKRIFYNPRTNQPWENHAQIRKTCWKYILKKAGVRYRNPTRHTYASMMLSAGENMLWLAMQMGHRDTEMIIKTYAKWNLIHQTKLAIILLTIGAKC